MLDILKYLHERNIIYKDLKLSHIFVEKESMNVKLIDFGMTEELDEYKTTSRPGGTYHCMSPEMASLFISRLKNEEPDYKNLPSFSSDIWTLGIFAIELVFKMKLLPFKHFNGTDKSNEQKIEYL